MGQTRRAARLLGVWTRRALLMFLVLGSGALPLAQPNVAQATNPQVAFGIGRGGADSGQAIGTDASGNVYVAGVFATSADLDPGSGTSNVTSAGGDDLFVAKYALTGELVWGKSYGSAGADAPTGLAVDATGVYVVGYFSGTANFGLGNVVAQGISDIFVVKLALADGSTLWQKRLGGSSLDRAQAVAVSGTGLYLTGRFQGTTNLGGSNLISAGGDDIFVARLATGDGSHVWSTRFGGSSATAAQDIGYGIASDGVGVWVTGLVVETVNFGGGNRAALGGEDIFALRLAAADGSHVWSDRFGGSENDRGSAVVVDDAGAYITGRFRRTVSFGENTFSSGGTDASTEDIFVLRLNREDGSHWWSHAFGGAQDDHGNAIALDSGRLYVVGSFVGTITLAGQHTSAGSPPSEDGFLLIVDRAYGNPITSFRMGGPGAEDQAFDVAAASNVAYVTGAFTGTADFGAGVSTMNLTSGGSTDAFVAKVDMLNRPPTALKPDLVYAPTNGSVKFEVAAGTGIVVSDPDVGTNPMRIEMSVNNGTLTLAGTTGLTFVTGDGINDAAITFLANVTNVNAALNGLTFRPNANYEGTTGLLFIARDQGYSGVEYESSVVVGVQIVVAPMTATPSPTGTLSPSPTGTLTPGPTGTVAPTQPVVGTPIPTATAIPVSCDPRPRVRVQTTSGGKGQIQAVISAESNAAGAANVLRQIQLGTATNARVDFVGVPNAPSGSSGNVTVSLTANTSSVTLLVRRQAAGAFGVPLTVTDGCGAWPTLVGGGTRVN